MKAFNEYIGAVPAIGFAMVIMSLTACDQGTESNIDTTSTEMNEVVKIEGNAGAENGIKPAETIIITNTDGYSAGYEFGSQLAKIKYRHSEFDLKAAFSGLIDALSDALIRLDVADISAALQALSPPVVTDTKPPQIVARYRGFKDDYAALNARREGVVILPSGVQYEVLKSGSGKQPQAGDAVHISYQASLTNGTVFDTTYDDDEPLHMPVDDIALPGLKEALLLMNEGAKWQVVIPPSMGFGNIGNNMLRRKDLIYDIELISIETAQESKL